MQNINNLVSDLQKYYNEKYNGKKFPNGYIAGLVASNGFEYVEGRYLLIDGEKVRLDSFCREHKITCNYTSTVNHSTNGEMHVITANLNGKKLTEPRKTSNTEKLNKCYKLFSELCETYNVKQGLAKQVFERIEAAIKAEEEDAIVAAEIAKTAQKEAIMAKIAALQAQAAAL